MTVKLQYLVFLLLAAALAAGCAGSEGTRTAPDPGVYTESLGTADRETLVNDTREALQVRYGYRFEREVLSTEDVRLETDWKMDTALEDEQAEGAAHARTRIIITARPRNRSTSTAQSYAVRYRFETELQELGSDVWRSAEPTAMRLDYIKQIANFLKNEYRTALR